MKLWRKIFLLVIAISLIAMWQPTPLAMAETNDYDAHCQQSYDQLETQIKKDYASSYQRVSTQDGYETYTDVSSYNGCLEFNFKMVIPSLSSPESSSSINFILYDDGTLDTIEYNMQFHKIANCDVAASLFSDPSDFTMEESNYDFPFVFNNIGADNTSSENSLNILANSCLYAALASFENNLKADFGIRLWDIYFCNYGDPDDPQNLPDGDGTSMSSAYEVQLDEEYTRTWNSGNYKNKFLNKVTVSTQSEITLALTKPQIPSDMYFGGVNTYVYDASGNLIADPILGFNDNSILDTYNYSIFLKAGTYYFDMNPSIRPSYYIDGGEVSTTYSFSARPVKYSETELNNSAATANVITENIMYEAYLGSDDGLEIDEDDYYKFDVSAGEEVTVKLGNFAELKSDTAILKIYFPDGSYKNVSLYLSMKTTLEDIGTYTFTVDEAGTCYLVLFNYSDKSMYYQVGYSTKKSGQVTPSEEEPVEEQNNNTHDCNKEGHSFGDWAVFVDPDCTEDGIESRFCKYCDFEEERNIPATGHKWDSGKVTKKATTTSKGVMTYTCTECGETKTKSIPKVIIDEKDLSPDGTAMGEGASSEAAEATITGTKTDKDLKGSVFNKLRVEQSKATKTSITIKWKKIKGAKKYLIFAGKSGKNYKVQNVATLKSTKTKYTLKKFNKKKLTKGTYYKFAVVALNSKGKVITSSKFAHVATLGKNKASNPAKVTVSSKVKKNKITLKVKKTFKLKGAYASSAKKYKIRKVLPMRYESTNPKVATVSTKGVIKAKKKGTCYVLAYAQNGLYKRIKVTVKK